MQFRLTERGLDLTGDQVIGVDPATGALHTWTFEADGGVGENRLEHSVPLRFTTYAGLDVGKDNGEPVSRSYAAQSPFAFTGKVERVVFDLAPEQAPR